MDEYERRVLEVHELMHRFDAGDFDFTNSFFATGMSTEELVRHYGTGQREFPNVGLTSLDLSGINLAGANLTGAKLVSANLSSANLTGANLSYAYLAGANLSSANLTGANLSYAFLAGANLENANLRGAIDEGIQDHMAFYRNTIRADGSLEVGPYWAEG